jgi:hypothetical protein
MPKIGYQHSLALNLRLCVKALRAAFEETEISRFKLEIEVSGEVMSGDLKVEYALREGSWGEPVKGGDLQAVFDELLRRKGWTERNAPLCLPRVDDDDIRELPQLLMPANTNGAAAE